MEAMSVLPVHCMIDFQDFQILAVTVLSEVLFVCLFFTSKSSSLLSALLIHTNHNHSI